MKKITFVMLFAAMAVMSAWGQGLTASFAADEASVPYYLMGWDTLSEFDNHRPDECRFDDT